MIQFKADEFVPSPLIDLVFKAMFTQNTSESRIALMDFLESIIGRGVKEVTIQGNEPPPNRLGEKQPSMDFNCLFNDGNQANVEIQVEPNGKMAPRSEYYLCRLHCAQANKGMEYEELRYTYQITVLDYSLLPPDRPYLNEYELRDSSGRPLEGSRILIWN